MSNIVFTETDRARLAGNYAKWWAGTLGRPIVPIVTYGYDAPADAKSAPPLIFPNSWDMSITPGEFIDAADAHLATLRFHGEAFPMFATTAFGPGVAAAFMGCTPISAPNTVWFKPPRDNIPIGELHFEFDPDNVNYRRVLAVFEEGMERWRGDVVIGMADLGGVADILSSFRGTENLLCDLYDSPDEVKRCLAEIQTAWFKYYDALNDVTDGVFGYSQWFSMYSPKPSYIMQSDFSYMISRAMFDEFIAPELSSSGGRLYNALYHMDGVGQINHLDTLLATDSIKAIQWVPGDGEPLNRNWDELLTKILSSGKKLISLTQKSDGTLADFINNPCQVYTNDRYFHFTDVEGAKRYAEKVGFELKF